MMGGVNRKIFFSAPQWLTDLNFFGGLVSLLKKIKLKVNLFLVRKLRH